VYGEHFGERKPRSRVLTEISASAVQGTLGDSNEKKQSSASEVGEWAQEFSICSRRCELAIADVLSPRPELAGAHSRVCDRWDLGDKYYIKL
jgi:hypothetical protein